MTTQTEVTTDFKAGTLSAEDREAFLRASGITRVSPEKAQQIREAWSDEDILAAMEMGAA